MDGRSSDLGNLDDLVALSLGLAALTTPRDPALSKTRVS